MKLYKRPKSGVWCVRFKTKHGWKRINTHQTDLEKAKQIIKAANIEGIEMAREINLVASAASMYALCGRVIDSEHAFNEWYVNIPAMRAPTTVTRYEPIVRGFLEKLKWPRLNEIKSVD